MTILLENLDISPKICPVGSKVTIDVTATNYGDETASKTIKCTYYKEVTGMTVIFSGTVSAQEVAGEVVTITVTLPGGGTEKVTTPTLADKTFSTEYTNVPGDYTAKARVEADSLYGAAESDVVPFSIGKEPRTITLTVTPK